MVDLIADPQWDAFLKTMIEGAGMLQPAPFDPVGGVMGIPPVGDDDKSGGGGMGGMDMQGMMGMFGGGGGGGAGAMGGGVGFAANGGTFPGGMPVVVGEQGPEVVMSQGNTSVIPLPPGSNVTQNLPYQPVPAGAGVHPGNIMQNMPYPAPQPGGGMDINRMMQQLLMAQVAGNVKTAEPEQKKGFNWLMMIPGFAKGAAMATKMNQEKELLTLRKQQQQGQEAAVKMQQLEMIRKLQRQEAMDKLGPLFGRLYSGDETMEDAERQQLEGIIFEELARNGSPDQLEKFQEQRIAARQQRLVRKAMEEGEAPQAPAPAGGVSSPSGSQPALGSGQGTAPTPQSQPMRERLVLQRLEQELAREEAKMKRLAPLVTMKGGKEAYKAAEDRANELADRIDKIHSRGLTQQGQAITMRGQDLHAESSMRAANRQAEAVEKAADRAYDAATAKNKAELESAPLDVSIQQKVAPMDTSIRFVNTMLETWQPGFTGKLEGPLGTVHEFTGNISTDRVEFNRLLADMVTLLGQARSGAAISPQEYARLEKLLPKTSDADNVFIDKMRGFGKAVEQSRDDFIRAATTPRGKYLETAPRVNKGTTAPAATKPVGEMTLEDAKNREAELIKQLKGMK